MYRFRMLEKSKSINDEVVYIIYEVFNPKYAIEASSKRIKKHIKNNEIANVKHNTEKIEMCADAFDAVADYIHANTSKVLHIVQLKYLDSRPTTKRYLKIYTPNGVNISTQIYHILSRYEMFSLDVEKVALVIKNTDVNLPINYYIEQTIQLLNREGRTCLLDENIVLNYIFYD